MRNGKGAKNENENTRLQWDSNHQPSAFVPCILFMEVKCDCGPDTGQREGWGDIQPAMTNDDFHYWLGKGCYSLRITDSVVLWKIHKFDWLIPEKK